MIEVLPRARADWLGRASNFAVSSPSAVLAVTLGSIGVTSFQACGAVIWVDPEHDIVAVLRWIDPASIDSFLRLLMAAIQ